MTKTMDKESVSITNVTFYLSANACTAKLVPLYPTMHIAIGD